MFTTHYGLHQLVIVCEALGRYRLLQTFTKGPLGYFIQIPLHDEYSVPQLVGEVLVREVTFPGAWEDEMWLELGGVPYRYGKQEFILISGLRFGAIDKEQFEVRLLQANRRCLGATSK